MNLIVSDTILFGSDMIFFGSIFQVHKLSILLVAIVIDFVKKQVPHVFFKTAAGDLISFHTFGSDMKLFGSDMILFGSDLILFGSIFKFQEPSVMLVAALINFGVKNQVPQVSFKIIVGDLISHHSFGSDMNLFRYDLFFDIIIFGLVFKIQELLVMLVAALIILV